MTKFLLGDETFNRRNFLSRRFNTPKSNNYIRKGDILGLVTKLLTDESFDPDELFTEGNYFLRDSLPSININ